MTEHKPAAYMLKIHEIRQANRRENARLLRAVECDLAKRPATGAAS